MKSSGKVTTSIDPLGRKLTYSYSGDNDTDLRSIKNTTGTLNEQLVGMDYTDEHLPKTITDAAGQTTHIDYNGSGQPKKITDPNGHETNFHYNDDGYLEYVTAPGSNITHYYSDDFEESGERSLLFFLQLQILGQVFLGIWLIVNMVAEVWAFWAGRTPEGGALLVAILLIFPIYYGTFLYTFKSDFIWDPHLKMNGWRQPF